MAWVHFYIRIRVPDRLRECLLVVPDEEWCHRQYAERDLTALTQE